MTYKEYTHVYVPTLDLCTIIKSIDSTWIRVFSKKYCEEKVKESDLECAESFLMYSGSLKSYQDYIKKQAIELFKDYLLSGCVCSSYFKYLENNSHTVKSMYNTIMYLCSNGGLEVLEHKADKENSYYSLFHKLNKKTIGINDNKRLIETLAESSTYSIDTLETVENIFRWFDTKSGFEFLNKVKDIRDKELRTHNNSIQLYSKLSNVLDRYKENSYTHYKHDLAKEIEELCLEIVGK